MLSQRRRRWANIERALGEWPVFAGLLHVHVYITVKRPHNEFLTEDKHYAEYFLPNRPH